VSLYRVDHYPTIDGPGAWRPDEILYLDLPNNERLGLPWQAYAAVMPVVHDPSGTVVVEIEGKLKVAPEACVPGTAFSVFPQYGLFVTAAHVLPDDAERAVARNEVAVLLPTPAGRRLPLRIRNVVLDRDNDVALCSAGIVFQDFHYPYIPPLLEDDDLRGDVVLYASGFPDTSHSADRIDLLPTAYVGERAERITGKYQVRSRGSSISLSGDFIRVEMNSRPGMSGGPLCASRIMETKRTRQEERSRVRGGCVGVMSWRRVDSPGFTETDGFFADVRRVLDLRLPVDGALTLRDLYARTPHRAPPDLSL
jgi:hypothetical protein